MNEAARRQIHVARELWAEGVVTGDVSLMAESAVEYRAVLQLLGINPDTGDQLDAETRSTS